jgi:hypothetical protein
MMASKEVLKSAVVIDDRFDSCCKYCSADHYIIHITIVKEFKDVGPVCRDCLKYVNTEKLRKLYWYMKGMGANVSLYFDKEP